MTINIETDLAQREVKFLRSDHPEVLADRRFRTANRWPTDLPDFRETIVAYCDTMEQLVRKLGSALR